MPLFSNPLAHALALLISVSITSVFSANNPKEEKESIYQLGTASRDGIGKFYMGREISQVMGHLGASWLERPRREQEERTDLLIKSMKIKPADRIADIGAGSGYFSFRMSDLVPRGKVFAVDISPKMLGIIRAKIKEQKVTNVFPIQSTITRTMLEPSSIDKALIVDAYHEFSHPREMANSIFKSLKKDGLLILIEYRKEDKKVPIKPLHKMTEKQAIEEIEVVGFKWEKTLSVLPQQHFMIFKKN
ncbi:MAG TPA: SAM-dependent methyltransferase [Opitutae bacterium]|nr:SAM-dependent methyltransferase [Opitutae bacterium]|tara:strand:- start:10157 stop:10894 length:738 start_codon:yes stop_codon:yes gene_type:complete